MAKKIFNVEEWKQPIPVPSSHPQQPTELSSTRLSTEMEEILKRVEERKIDLTSTYEDWRNLGFALAEGFGEAGREYFHRLSSFYPDYDPKECDDQFSKCLKSRGSGVTLKSFFFRVKQAGIPISKPQAGPVEKQAPTFPDEIVEMLPVFLKEIAGVASTPEERDILILGSVVVLSATMPKVWGLYDEKKVYPNLFLYVTAKASAGKGRLVHCRQLVNPIHKHLREQAKLIRQQYEADLATYNDQKKRKDPIEKPQKPPEKMLFLPANSSSTGIFQLLFENEGRGLIFETEGDTLALAFKSEHGNYSDGFRKAFHHETISFYRRTDREYVDIEHPLLSAVLSGTPNQILSLIPSAENGLFSRFIFYTMNIRPEWKDVFAQTSVHGLDEYFAKLGNRYFQLFNQLEANPPIRFHLNQSQQNQFNATFQEIHATYLESQGLDFLSVVRRHGLIAFRLMMIFSVLRIMETGDLTSDLCCEKEDFKSALSLTEILARHSSLVFQELPQTSQVPKTKNQKQRFLDALPLEFCRQDYLALANQMGIKEKTAEGYITKFADAGDIHRDKKDHYQKPKPAG